MDSMSFSDRFATYVMKNKVPNEELFKVLNHCLDFLQCKTVSEFAEEKGISVQAVYKLYPVKTLVGRKVIFDND